MKSNLIPKEANRLIADILMGERSFEGRTVERYDFSVHPDASAVQEYLAKESSEGKLSEHPFGFVDCDLTRVGIPFPLPYARFWNSILLHVRFDQDISDLTGATFIDCVLKNVTLPYHTERMQTSTSILTNVRTPKDGKEEKGGLLYVLKTFPVGRAISGLYH